MYCVEPHYGFIARRLDANKIQKDKLNYLTSISVQGWAACATINDLQTTVVTDLGVVLDNQMTMGPQVTAVTRSCFYLLMRQLRVVQRSLTKDALRSFVQAFMHCRLDYCNALLAGITDTQIKRLQ